MKKYYDHQNSAMDIVADTSSPVIIKMDDKPISGRGYMPAFNRFLFNVQCPNEINQWLTLLEIRCYTTHLDYRKSGFLKDKHNLESYLTLS